MARKDRKARNRAARRATKQLSAAQLRDRAARSMLAQAESLRTSFWISNTTHLPQPAILTERRHVTYPMPIDGGAGARSATCWQLATVAEAVEPWRPAPGDPALEGPWSGSGGWTADLVREWLAEAMETLRTCPSDHPGGWRSSMPDVVRQAALAYGWDAPRIRLVPSPAALGRLDIVLQWLFLLDEVDQRKAVVGVAMGLSLRRIARTIGRSHTHVATLERRAVEDLVAILNGEAVEG